jgi:hypothetical protein
MSLPCRLAPVGHRREFAYIINTLLREDDESASKYLAIVVRTINVLLIHRSSHRFIQTPKENTVYRGGGLPNEHRLFFVVGKKYRYPGFLATSLQESVAWGFMHRAADRKEPCVLWVIRVPPLCMQVHFVQRTHIQGEEEYLFAPYSPFVVLQVSL